MLVSEQLEIALAEDDIDRSLSGLAKFNAGLWKSEKQGSFLLDKIGVQSDPSTGAMAWARSQGFSGPDVRAFYTMNRIEGYGKSDITKTRYWSQVFVVDSGGVVAIGKAKVKHPTATEPKLDIDWGSVEITFKRTVSPAIRVDKAAELAAKIKAAEPDIALVKTIPGWERIDILADFIAQLEAGGSLSPNQKRVVQKYLPEKQVFLGDQEHWKKLWVVFGDIVSRLLGGMKEAWVAHDTQMAADEAEAKTKGSYWGHRHADPEGAAADFEDALAQWKSGVSTYGGALDGWISTQVMISLHDMARYSKPGILHLGLAEIRVEATKAMKAKKPTKAGLATMGMIASIVDKLEGKSVAWFAAEESKRFSYKK